MVWWKQELKRFPTLQVAIAGAAGEALEKFREESKKTVIRLVDMESSYLTVDFFRKLPQEVGSPVATRMEKGGNPAAAKMEKGGTPAAAKMEKGGTPATINVDRHAEGHFRRIGSNVSSYVGMVSDTLRSTIPKAVVYCQVREAKQSLLNYFYTQIGRKEVPLPPPFCISYSFARRNM